VDRDVIRIVAALLDIDVYRSLQRIGQTLDQASETIAENLAAVPDDILLKILHRNAVNVYWMTQYEIQNGDPFGWKTLPELAGAATWRQKGWRILEEELRMQVEFQPALRTQDFFETFFGLAQQGRTDPRSGMPGTWRCWVAPRPNVRAAHRSHNTSAADGRWPVAPLRPPCSPC
jgi:hypothetical protein